MDFAEAKPVETAPTEKQEPSPAAEKPVATAVVEPAPQPEPTKPYKVFQDKDSYTAALKEAVKNKEHEKEQVELTAKELAEKASKLPELEAKLNSLTDERKLDKWVQAGYNPKQFAKFKADIKLENGKDNIAEIAKAYDLNPLPVPDALAATSTKTETQKPQPKRTEYINPYTGLPTTRDR